MADKDNQPYTPLAKILADGSAKKTIDAGSTAAGHDAFFPVPVVMADKNGKTVVRGQIKRAAPEKDRGRPFVFLPTGERVTVVREKLGQSYSGDWIHEVISRDGKKFLASVKQLGEQVR